MKRSMKIQKQHLKLDKEVQKQQMKLNRASERSASKREIDDLAMRTISISNVDRKLKNIAENYLIKRLKGK
jgi:hypothetical protein